MGNSVFVGSCSGNFYAFERSTGAIRWSYDTSQDGEAANFHGHPFVTEDLVVVGTDTESTGHLYAFDARTGELRWKQTAERGFPADVAASGSRVCAVSVHGELRSLERETGESAWTFDAEQDVASLRSSVVPAGDRILLTLQSGRLFAIDASSGESVWNSAVEGRINTTAALSGDRLYVGDLGGRIYRLDARNGQVEATFETEGPVYGSLISAGPCLLALSAETTLACLDPSLDSVRWTRTTSSIWSTFRPLIWNGLVLVGDEEGTLHAFRLEDGTPEWTYELEGEIKGLGASEDTLFAGTLGGTIFAFRPGGGRRTTAD